MRYNQFLRKMEDVKKVDCGLHMIPVPVINNNTEEQQPSQRWKNKVKIGKFLSVRVLLQREEDSISAECNCSTR
jgi:hypothetical protein